MAYLTRYRIPILNPGVSGVINSETPYAILIQERDYNGNPTTLKGTVSAAVLRYVNNNETKYQSICASELDISFYSENNFNLQDIITDDDFQFRVIVSNEDYRGDATYRPVWVGWLSTDDCYEQMQDDPKVISLKAIDGIAYLKKKELYDIDVYEKKTLLEIIDKCILFIGPPIKLQIECDVFEESMIDKSTLDTAHPFDQCKIHTGSLMKDANTYNDAYTVLEQIMTAFQCSFFQQNGRWNIKRHHDRWNNAGTKSTILSYPYTESEREGKLYDYRLNIDTTNRLPINADHQKSYAGASQYTKIQFDYAVPDQLPRNNNFKQGVFLSPVSGPNNIATTLKYWEYKNFIGEPKTSIIPYRNQTFDTETGLPSDSYIVLPSVGESWEPNYIESQPIEVLKGDRLKFSCDLKQKFKSNNQSNLMVCLYIKGNNNSDWFFHKIIGLDGYYDDVQKWVNNFDTVQVYYSETEDTTEWKSADFKTDPFPIDGLLYVRFYSDSTKIEGGAPVPFYNEKWFRNISYEWMFFINGTTQINGEFDRLTNQGVFRNDIDQSIQIGDAPKKVISGALFNSDGSALTKSWHRQGKNEVEKLIRINDIALYQSSYRLYSKIEGSFLNISYPDPDDNNKPILVGPANTFQFSFPQLANKHYISTNLEISLSQNTFRAFLQEFYDTTKDNGDPQPTNKTFQYIYE